MDQMAVENCSNVSAKESLPDFGNHDLTAVFLPPVILPEIYRGKSGKIFYPVYTREAIALRWALDRLAGWELPGKDHVEEYIRSMFMSHASPGVFQQILDKAKSPDYRNSICIEPIGIHTK